MPPSSFTFQIDAGQVATLRARLEEMGYELSPLEYGHFRTQHKLKKVSVQAYQSGKLLVQGKGAAEFIEFFLEPEILGEAKLGYEAVHNPEMFQPHIGVDESGKGDFFGPLVIAGVYVDSATVPLLLEAGVKDSKLIKSDKKAREMADTVKEIVGARHSVIAIGPEKYNQLYLKFRNLNRLLAWGHATVIETLLVSVPHCPRAISDQFADARVLQAALKEKGKKIELVQRTKAESDVAVAAASILARAEFLIKLERLGETLAPPQVLPKGASAQVSQMAQRLYAAHGAEGLARVAKSHFKTFAEAGAASLRSTAPEVSNGDL